MNAKKIKNSPKPISDQSEKTYVDDSTQVLLNPEIVSNEPPVLYVVSGPHKIVGQAWVLQKDRVIGREQEQSHIIIQSTGISRKHVLIKYQKNRVQIQDLGSTNGTFLNDEKMTAHEIYDLKNNDLIQIGKVVFKFAAKGQVEGRHVLHVQNQIYQDDLCQINNRLFMEMKAKECVSTAKKTQLSFCFSIFDIDFFKKINDKHSHLAGDFILFSVSQLVQKTIRKDDIFCRIGGEEFGLLLFCSMKSATQLMEKIRKKIESEVFNFENKDLKITISAGVSCFQKGDTSWKDIYARADKFLYQSKKSGRNQVCYDK